MRKLLCAFSLIVLVAGCSSQNSNSGDGSWPYLGWDSNTPSLRPVTNIVVEPDWSVVPGPSKR